MLLCLEFNDKNIVNYPLPILHHTPLLRVVDAFRLNTTLIQLVWIHHHISGMGAGSCPDEGHLAADADGSPILALLCKGANRLTVLRLPSARSSRVEVRLARSTVCLATVGPVLHALHTQLCVRKPLCTA